MVATRSGLETKDPKPRSSSVPLFIVSAIVALVAISGALTLSETVEHKVQSLYERSQYAFGGSGGAAREYWRSVPSWEELKAHAGAAVGAAGARTLPEPSLWQSTKAFVQRKSVRQVQAEDAYGRGQAGAADAADYAKQAVASVSDYASDASSEVSSQARSLPDRARQLLFGIKTRAVKERERQARVSADAQWRSEYASKEGFFAKLQHVLLSPAKLPSSRHYDAASDSAGSAYDHASKAANEAYAAAKDAAAGVAAGARGAARSAQGAASVASDAGSRASGSVQETASSAYEASRGPANTAQEKARAGYDKTADAASQAYQATADAANTATGKAQGAAAQAGLAAEKAAHRTQEAAQQAKHRARETYDSATT